MKIDEIRAFSAEEIRKQLVAANREFMELRFKLATKQLVNHRQIPAVKKKAARLQTVLRERTLGIR
ncbi:50S ribosomal protein L29 [Dehalogenimonas alkenigignens]|uniref:Large ribosomal subunit protein uL29 n=1 Tax=Dehalogenimonas alkenigignens TaxID=1217799 RepID=A0A0W0GFZ8_9CHLR|nr:50S ribosomal protein L29 [Dehalogenimonas alkenigignens]KTB47477.1 LSU ribosomal protein L29P [Dehalogenimonas alkenigignens]PVV83464.1 50S ribosomal protein L29 [Dehalogenimonas alkenigignens]